MDYGGEKKYKLYNLKRKRVLTSVSAKTFAEREAAIPKDIIVIGRGHRLGTGRCHSHVISAKN